MRLSLGNKHDSFDLNLTLDDHVLDPGAVRMLAPGNWFVLVSQGTLVPSFGLWSQPVKEHGLLFLPLRQPLALGSREACRCLALQLDSGGFAALEGCLLQTGTEVVEAFTGPGAHTLSPQDAREVLRLMQSIQSHGESGREFSGSLMCMRIMEIMLVFQRAVQEHTRLESSGVWTIDDVVAWVDNNFTQDISLADLVSKCALNTTDFSRLFKIRTGYPLFEYLNRVRIHRSCVLLKKSRMTILEIAMDVGYNNISFYNRYFQRIVGTTPSEFRNRP